MMEKLGGTKLKGNRSRAGDRGPASSVWGRGCSHCSSLDSWDRRWWPACGGTQPSRRPSTPRHTSGASARPCGKPAWQKSWRSSRRSSRRGSVGRSTRCGGWGCVQVPGALMGRLPKQATGWSQNHLRKGCGQWGHHRKDHGSIRGPTTPFPKVEEA